MIFNLLFTDIGILILLSVFIAILIYCIIINHLVWSDRHKLLISIKPEDPTWPRKISYFETRDSYVLHLRKRLFLKDWKCIYKPDFSFEEKDV